MNTEVVGLTFQEFIEGWELFGDSAIAGGVAGTMLGVLGVYVVVRRMVFLSATVSQAAGLGIALSYYAHLHLGVTGLLAAPSVGAIMLTLPLVLGLAFVRRGNSDTLLGFTFLFTSATTLVVGNKIVEELQDINDLLFGTAVAVLPEDAKTLLWTAALLLGLQLWWWRGFVAVTLDTQGARVRGLPTRTLDVALLTSLALGVAVTTRVLGALPAFAFSVLPGMAALRLAPNLRSALVLAGIFGATAGFGGYLMATLYDLPVGASQALTGAALVAMAEALRVVMQQVRRVRSTGPVIVLRK